MLRELSIRELTDIEMDMVSGGEGDEIVVTGTRIRNHNPEYQAAMRNLANMYARAGMAEMMANISRSLINQGFYPPAQSGPAAPADPVDPPNGPDDDEGSPGVVTPMEGFLCGQRTSDAAVTACLQRAMLQ